VSGLGGGVAGSRSAYFVRGSVGWRGGIGQLARGVGVGLGTRLLPCAVRIGAKRPPTGGQLLAWSPGWRSAPEGSRFSWVARWDDGGWRGALVCVWPPAYCRARFGSVARWDGGGWRWRWCGFGHPLTAVRGSDRCDVGIGAAGAGRWCGFGHRLTAVRGSDRCAVQLRWEPVDSGAWWIAGRNARRRWRR